MFLTNRSQFQSSIFIHTNFLIDRNEIYNIYIRQVAQSYGVTHTRPIYEKAIEKLPDDYARDFYVRFADMETKLGEIDRARAIYMHCSQICDPRVSLYL